jgi:predicted transcriptional regulator
MKPQLLEKTCVFLLRNGYTVKTLTHTCFDALARREDRILLIKILEDANAISSEYANEMCKVSTYLHGAPVIVAEKAGASLQDNIVYSRFGIYCLNFTTFKHSILNKFPFVYRDRAGLTAMIDGCKLRETRQKKGFSLSALADRVGVSKAMVQKYEKQEAKVTISKALKLHKLLGGRIFQKIDIFSQTTCPAPELKTEIGKKFGSMGFDATETRKVPFDVIAKKEEELVLTEVGDRRHPHLKPVSQMLDAKNLVIYRKKKPKKVPSLTKKEFMEFQKAYELIKFLKDY